MSLTPETILALGALVTAVATALGTFVAARKSARKDEVTMLRDEVARLQERIDHQTVENMSLHKEVIYLQKKNAWLLIVLGQHNITVPEMPDGFLCEDTLIEPVQPKGLRHAMRPADSAKR